MRHETTVVKKASKKYKTADGVEKESISKRISLKKDSIFEIGDEIVLLPVDEFNKISGATSDDIAELKNDIADKDAIINELNESNAKLNAELKDKFNKINDVTAKLKASEKKIVNLESDISAKADIIAELKSEIADVNADIKNNEKTIVDLNADVDELNKALSDSKQYLLDKDDIIVDLEKQIAVLNATDISELKQKAKDLDAVKDDLIEITKRLDNKSNVISLLQNQIMEYIQLVNYYKETSNAYKNQNVINKLIGRDATADIIEPTLYLIDSSGNVIADDNIVDVDAESDNDKQN